VPAAKMQASVTTEAATSRFRFIGHFGSLLQALL